MTTDMSNEIENVTAELRNCSQRCAPSRKGDHGDPYARPDFIDLSDWAARLESALWSAQPVAWMNPDGPRVVTEQTMSGARKDGGAILSSLRGYSIPLYLAPVIPAAWQPIETAPKDGADILAITRSWSCAVVRWLEADHPDSDGEPGFHESWSHDYVDNVTHWMPLPEPPK